MSIQESGSNDNVDFEAFGHHELHYVVRISKPDCQPKNIRQWKFLPVGVIKPGNVPLCINTRLQTKGKRVLLDGIIAGLHL